tara:strand:+ start:128 stop:649 length:522 start_codon:yes stop_codon:yes gene_type:complete
MGKNIEKVQEMVDGNYKRKIQVSMHGEKTPDRKVGDKWTDSDGVEWEQKKGYISKINKLPNVGLGDSCSDCKKLIIKKWDKDVYKWNQRCYYCQIDYEAQYSRPVGAQSKDTEHGQYLEGKYENFKENYIKQFEEENKELIKEMEKMENPFDTKVANALANGEVEVTINKNKS